MKICNYPRSFTLKVAVGGEDTLPISFINFQNDIIKTWNFGNNREAGNPF